MGKKGGEKRGEQRFLFFDRWWVFGGCEMIRWSGTKTKKWLSQRAIYLFKRTCTVGVHGERMKWQKDETVLDIKLNYIRQYPDCMLF